MKVSKRCDLLIHAKTKQYILENEQIYFVEGYSKEPPHWKGSFGHPKTNVKIDVHILKFTVKDFVHLYRSMITSRPWRLALY